MKNKIYITILYALFSFSLIAQQTSEKFYYYQGKKISLQQRTDKMYLKFEPNANKEQIRAIISSDTSLQASDVNLDDHFSNFIILKAKKGKQISSTTMKSFKKRAEIVSATPLLQYNNASQGLTDEFVVKLKETTSYEQLEELAKQNNCKVEKENQFVKNQFMISVSKSSDLDALQMSNLFFETGLFEFSEPNFVILDAFNSDDTHFDQQWALKNTGQNGGTTDMDIRAEQAWTISTGANVKVAVVDMGVDLTHPDLQEHLLTGFDASGTNSGGAPVWSGDNHGTACAGIIGAVQNNKEGISGVAPNCSIIPIHVNDNFGYINQNWAATAIDWAWRNGADVISNSWGGGSPNTSLTNAINNAATQGRGGKGCVIVFSSGNDNATTVQYPADLTNVIAVGAVDRCGVRSGRIDIVPNSCDPWCPTCKPGSTYGSALSVVAPGSNIYTTDRQGTAGYNTADGANGDYYSGFGGTSAACPYVAGVAALILAVNPNLTQFQVRQAIESSCTKLRYNFGYVYPNGTWNNEVGYGLVNAYKAILASLLSGPSEVCYSGSQFTLQNQQLPGVITWTVSAPFSIASSVNNTATVIRDGDALNDGTLQASVNGIVVGVKTISPCAAPSIAGPSGVCPGSTATYSISGNTDNLPVTWSSILLTQNNNFQGTSKIFTAPSSTGAGQVSVSLMVDNQQAVTIRKSVYIGNNSVSINGSPSIAAESSVTYNAALSCSATDVSWTLQAVNSSASETGTGSSIVVYSVKDLSLPYSNTPTY